VNWDAAGEGREKTSCDRYTAFVVPRFAEWGLEAGMRREDLLIGVRRTSARCGLMLYVWNECGSSWMCRRAGSCSKVSYVAVPLTGTRGRSV
jgi:hypothetical protein